MIPKYWRQNKKMSTPQDNEDGGLCTGEIIVAGEVLGVSQCLDSTAGDDAVKLVNPVETGISLAGGRPAWQGGCRSLSLRTVPCCGGTPHFYPTPLGKPAPGAVWSNTLKQKDWKPCTTAHQFATTIKRLRQFGAESEGVFTGVQLCKWRWLRCAPRPTWGLLHPQTPLISPQRLYVSKLSTAFLSHSSFLTHDAAECRTPRGVGQSGASLLLASPPWLFPPFPSFQNRTDKAASPHSDAHMQNPPKTYNVQKQMCIWNAFSFREGDFGSGGHYV